uniref:B30.2/SPRY domain-containing protein n=1 Tax=Paramoeba aestuarina TaxID=180227 RepID=A0A7S4JLG8_9EUKA
MSQRPKKAQLSKAADRAEGDIGEVCWDPTHNPNYITLSEEGTVAQFVIKEKPKDGKTSYPPCFLPVRSNLRLHSGNYKIEFDIERTTTSEQIGAGAMLMWNIGEDWGFFGYLGASSSAWSYDPSTGDVVTKTESIDGGLATFDGPNGKIIMELTLPRNEEGSMVFEVNGKRSKAVKLPAGSVVMPAGCFLKQGQKLKITLIK